VKVRVQVRARVRISAAHLGAGHRPARLHRCRPTHLDPLVITPICPLVSTPMGAARRIWRVEAPSRLFTPHRLGTRRRPRGVITSGPIERRRYRRICRRRHRLCRRLRRRRRARCRARCRAGSPAQQHRRRRLRLLVRDRRRRGRSSKRRADGWRAGADARLCCRRLDARCAIRRGVTWLHELRLRPTCP